MEQRFDNFDRAFALLREVYERSSILCLDWRRKAFQRFKVAFELAWKTIKDYLEESAVVVNQVTPRNVIKEAFTARLLDDADVWMDTMLHRNPVFHRVPAIGEVVLYGPRPKKPTGRGPISASRSSAWMTPCKPKPLPTNWTNCRRPTGST